MALQKGGIRLDTVTAPAETGARRQGSLTIFAGCFSGAGKSYAMLEAAARAARAGTDVAIGLLPLGRWPDTDALAQAFERLPCRSGDGEGQGEALDLDACLARRPQLLLVDDLSRRNGPGSRHRRRYQDVQELLKAGVDVYTTLDVPRIESIQDAVSAILGSSPAERVPDRVFDRAGQVTFIDCEPGQLAERLSARQGAGTAPRCSPEQLSALRELSLRRCADRAALYARDLRDQEGGHTREHILVCLSSAPSNAKIIRTAARMAAAFRCGFTALFVETKRFQRLSRPDRERLQANIRLARELGASIETVYGDDVAYQIAEFSRLSGVTKIVLGRSGMPLRPLFRKAALTERLIELTPELDIHIIPDSGVSGRLADRPQEDTRLPALSLPDLLKSAGILAAATLLGALFYRLGFTEANIITLYILGVMLISVCTTGSLCSLLASFVGVFAFNFFFTVPRFSLHAYDSGYPVTFLVMFLASLLTGSLAARLKSHAKRSAQVAWRTRLLFETNQSLQKARTREEILSVTARQLLRILQRDVAVYRLGGEELTGPELFLTEDGTAPERYTAPKEREAARWVAANNKRAGAGTETLSDALCTYLSVRSGERVFGVVGIAAAERPLDSFETDILLSVLGECALALENRRNLEEKEAAAVLAKNEQLRANLLRSVSHDLRTPLTSISGNASNLLSNESLFDAATRKQMYADIYDDAMWLINLVENLLSVSRLEEGRMQLRVSTELMDEVVAEALRHVSRKSADYHIHVRSGEEYLLARIDARLIVQVLINLVDNAIKYTPPGTDIDLSWRREGDFIQVSVADTGPGIADVHKGRIFDMFYSPSHPIADSRRSMGLGLALCKAIVNAHGGEISLKDRPPHGCIFTFTVPAGEVELHE